MVTGSRTIENLHTDPATACKPKSKVPDSLRDLSTLLSALSRLPFRSRYRIRCGSARYESRLVGLLPARFARSNTLQVQTHYISRAGGNMSRQWTPARHWCRTCRSAAVVTQGPCGTVSGPPGACCAHRSSQRPFQRPAPSSHSTAATHTQLVP